MRSSFEIIFGFPPPRTEESKVFISTLIIGVLFRNWVSIEFEQRKLAAMEENPKRHSVEFERERRGIESRIWTLKRARKQLLELVARETTYGGGKDRGAEQLEVIELASRCPQTALIWHYFWPGGPPSEESQEEIQ